MRNEIEHQLRPSRWLARARTQSQALAEARAQQTPPLIVPAQTRTHVSARPALAWVGLMLVMLLLGSGAWALVGRLEHAPPSPPPLAPVAPVALPKMHTIAKTLPLPATPPSPPLARHKHRPHTPEPLAPAPPPRTQALEQGDGEIIILPPPHEAEPPLFSPAEWKRAHQPPDPPR
jgi:hypothetical protein